MAETADALEKGQGHEVYDWYHYLWHLIAIGAVKRRPRTEDCRMPADSVGYILEADAWAALETRYPGKDEVVAQIDTGVNNRHPNLSGRIRDAVSFAAHPFGLCYPKRDQDGQADSKREQPRLVRGPEQSLHRSLISTNTWTKAERLAGHDPALATLIGRLKSGRGAMQLTAQTSRLRYPAHGTACAGLIVGAPATSPKPQKLVEGDGPIPYWGVAPGAELLPIEISAQPDAEQLILAFLYAWDQKVSVIHFPREVPDPKRSHKYHSKEGDDSRYTSPEAMAAWDYFEKLFERISEDIPIVCAAGNDGYDHLIYPASKATEHNGVIAVGAVSYLARRSAYSNYSGSSTDNAVTIAAPSDDQEAYTRHQMRLDKESARWCDHNFDIYEDFVPPIEEVQFAPQGVLTVDIPGRHGYSGGQLMGNQPPSVENRDRASLYTVFGGTSAASAIVAGAVALLQSKEYKRTGRRLTGEQVKARLVSAGAKTVSWPWLEKGPREIQTDLPNGEDAVDFEQQFGAGLLDLRKLLGSGEAATAEPDETVMEPAE